MATAAAAAVARARRNVIAHLMAANAVTPENAIDYAPVRRLERRQLKHLSERAVCHQTAAGRYWLDLPAYVDWHAGIRRRILAVVLALAVVIVLIVLLVPRH